MFRRGIRTLITLGESLLQASSTHGNRTAIIDNEYTSTWAEFCTRVARVASTLIGYGLKPAERLGVLSANTYRQAELFYAGYWCGVTVVPINGKLSNLEIREILQDSKCSVIAADAAGAEQLRSEELSDWRDSHISLEPVAYEKNLANAVYMPLTNTDPSSAALILYTGGTTGKAKGVPLTHTNILQNARQISDVWPGTKNDVVLHVAPMFHSADLVMTGMMLNGAAHAYLSRFTPKNLLAAIESYRVTVTMMVPTMLAAINRYEDHDKFDVSSLRRILYGASPMSRESLEASIKRFPNVEFTQGYGLTETSPLLAMLDHESHVDALSVPAHFERVGSCGHLLADVQLRIIDENDGDVRQGSSGELIVRGPNVFNGYLNAQNDNIAVDGSWFHTGDVGRIDEDGFLYVLDRKKDVIKVRGEAVNSGEVENILSRHPDIIEVTVIGIPATDISGESVLAVIVCRPNATLTRRDVREFCHGQIGAFKIPTRIVCVDELPKSALGKVLKSQLRQLYSQPPARSNLSPDP
ncbi:MAG: long-chain acyl-CoA synthetase [Porticoccaceae bacterium]